MAQQHTQYVDYYSDPTKDPFGGDYEAVLRPFDLDPADTSSSDEHESAALLERVTACAATGAPTAFLLLTENPTTNTNDDGASVAFATRLYHRVFRFPSPRMGLPATQWDGVCFALTGDVVRGQITTVRWPADALSSRTLSSSEPPMRVRRAVFVPPRYVRLFLRPLAPREALERAHRAIATDGLETPCAPLLRWLRAACAETAETTSSTWLSIGRPECPVADEDLIHYLWDLVENDLRGPASATRPSDDVEVVPPRPGVAVDRARIYGGYPAPPHNHHAHHAYRADEGRHVIDLVQDDHSDLVASLVASSSSTSVRETIQMLRRSLPDDDDDDHVEPPAAVYDDDTVLSAANDDDEVEEGPPSTVRTTTAKKRRRSSSSSSNRKRGCPKSNTSEHESSSSSSLPARARSLPSRAPGNADDDDEKKSARAIKVEKNTVVYPHPTLSKSKKAIYMDLYRSEFPLSDFKWRALWCLLRSLGWTTRNSPNSLENIIYVRPNRCPLRGEVGKDFFKSAKDLMDHLDRDKRFANALERERRCFVRHTDRMDQREKKRNPEEEEKKPREGTTTADGGTGEDDEKPKDGKTTTAATAKIKTKTRSVKTKTRKPDSARRQPSDRRTHSTDYPVTDFPWNILWHLLAASGWTYQKRNQSRASRKANVCTESDEMFYVAPGSLIRYGGEGTDYFSTASEVVEHLRGNVRRRRPIERCRKRWLELKRFGEGAEKNKIMATTTTTEEKHETAEQCGTMVTATETTTTTTEENETTSAKKTETKVEGDETSTAKTVEGLEVAAVTGKGRPLAQTMTKRKDEPFSNLAPRPADLVGRRANERRTRAVPTDQSIKRRDV